MQIHTILNQDGGTLKTTDLDLFSKLIEDEFRLHGHFATVERVEGAGVEAAIALAAEREDIDVLLVGGGDGTVSSAAGALMNHKVALGILPAGTMNLFARTLQIPQSIEAAVAALADGTIIEVDIATVNGTPFIHQFAVGMHARMVRMREKFDYGSRFGKMFATTKALVATLRRLPIVEAEIDIDGETRRIRTPALAVSNNVYGDGHLPFADDPRGGKLGVYIIETRDVRAVARLTLDILVGGWRRNSSLKVYAAKKVVIDYRGRDHRHRAVCDGELRDLDAQSVVEIHAKALRVLVPAEATYLAEPQA